MTPVWVAWVRASATTPAKIPSCARFLLSAMPSDRVPPTDIQAAWEFVPNVCARRLRQIYEALASHPGPAAANAAAIIGAQAGSPGRGGAGHLAG